MLACSQVVLVKAWIAGLGQVLDRRPALTLDPVARARPLVIVGVGQRAVDPELLVKVVSIPTLIKMKNEAGRPRDLDDVMHLEMIADETNN